MRTTMETFLTSIDWAMLRAQKSDLVASIEHTADAREWGIVALLDRLQDIAVDGYGYDEVLVFGEDEQSEEES